MSAPAVVAATPTPRGHRLVLILLFAHLAWGIARIPGKVFGKRLDRIEAYVDRGATAYHLDTKHLSGADVVSYLLDNTPEDCVLLWRGPYQGSLEFVPPLLAPRLLLEAQHVGAGATSAFGRQLATGRLPSGAEGVLVLVTTGDTLALEIAQ